MRKFARLITITVLLSFVPAAGQAWAAPAAEVLPSASSVPVLRGHPAEPTTAAPAATVATPRASIRNTLEELRQSPPVLLPNRPERAVAAAQQQTGRRGLNTAAKTAIWLSAVTVATVWAYKTFSVTRGTD